MQKTIYTELRELFSLKKSLDKILAHQAGVEKKLARLDTKLTKMQKAVAVKMKTSVAVPGRKRGPRAKKGQPPLMDVVVQVMQKAKTPLTISNLAKVIVGEKLYVSASKNFKNNLRVILYKNDKNLFKKIAPGTFVLNTGPDVKTAPKKAAAKKKVSTKKKVAAKKKATPKKKPASKKAAPKKEAAKQ